MGRGEEFLLPVQFSMAFGIIPLEQLTEQYIFPFRGKNGLPSNEIEQVAQQKHISVACQC